MASVDQFAEPFLPYELEHQIFTWAIQSSPSSAPNLMLVAHRVHQWIAPFVYKVANQLVKPYFPNTERQDAPSVHYFGPFVKHVVIGGDMGYNAIRIFLEACPNLIDLALWTHHSTKLFLPILEAMKLHRLSVNLTTLTDDDLKGPVFSSVSHLDVTVFSDELIRWKAFQNFPSLTHLAINDLVDEKVVQYLLEHCPKLQILLVVHHHPGRQNKNLTCAQIHDPRFVMMDLQRFTVKEWENGVYGEEDFWTCAEGISAAKHSNRFPKAEFCTWFTRHEWELEIRALLTKVDSANQCPI